MIELPLNKVKQKELELLRAFVTLCENNGLYYTLCGGTLLGAIRHKGFIPWDDDIDVLMPRPDYDRLLNDLDIDASCLPEYYKIVNWKNGTHDYPFLKLVDKRTRIEIPYLDDSYKANHIWIDIFPIDGNPDDSIQLNALFKKAKFYRQLIRLKTANPRAGKTVLKRMVKPLLVQAVRCLDNYKLCDKLDSVSKTYAFESCSQIGGVLWGYGPQERIDKKAFLTPLKVEFENELFNAPSNYDSYLSGLYGDYLKLPPEEKRVTHEMKCYFDDSAESIDRKCGGK